MYKFLKIISGGWHYMFGFCPECNSSAPYLYDCPVCEYKRAPRKYWWDRYISFLDKEDMPTFTFKCEKHKNCLYKGTWEQRQAHYAD